VRKTVAPAFGGMRAIKEITRPVGGMKLEPQRPSAHALGGREGRISDAGKGMMASRQKPRPV
jgi:hypothetical protein